MNTSFWKKARAFAHKCAHYIMNTLMKRFQSIVVCTVYSTVVSITLLSAVRAYISRTCHLWVEAVKEEQTYSETDKKCFGKLQQATAWTSTKLREWFLLGMNKGFKLISFYSALHSRTVSSCYKRIVIHLTSAQAVFWSSLSTNLAIP